MTRKRAKKGTAQGRAIRKIALPLLLVCAIKGDTIELKSGEHVDGKFKQATSLGAVLEVAGQPVTIPLDKVKAIYFGSAPPASAPTPTPFQEAFDALLALRSVTTSGVSYRDYAPRVLDTKVKVDRYISGPGSDRPELQKALRTAMAEYELASQAWSNTINVTLGITGVGHRIMEDPEIASCATIKPLIERLNPKKPRQNQYIEIAVSVGQRPALLWACASTQVGGAERLMADREPAR
jgi:hypothetical protein